MKPDQLLQYLIVGTFILLIIALLLSQLLGQPIIAFVETSSMEPTLEPNDGYLAIPALFVDDVEEGDIILFEAQELGGGELTTHRVVDETEEGYLTKGDANPFVDQEGDEPPVVEGQIKAVALELNGGPVVIPGLGATIGGTTDLLGVFRDRVLKPVGLGSVETTTISSGILVLGLSLMVFNLLTGTTDGRTRTRSRSVFDNAALLIALLTLAVVVPVNFSMLLPSGVYQYEVISSVKPIDAEQVIQAGGTSEITYFMRNSGHIPVAVFLEPASSGVETPEGYTYVGRQTTVNTSVTMHAPEETGVYARFVREYRYLVVLPPSLIATLHKIHPILAYAAINVTVAAAVILLAVSSLGTGRLRIRSKGRELTLREEIRLRRPGIGGPASALPGETEDSLYDWLDQRGRSDQRSSGRTQERFVQEVNQTWTDGVSGLTDQELTDVYEALQRPPAAANRDATRWTVDGLQAHLEESYRVTCPVSQCAWLLEQAGVEPERQTARSTDRTGDTPGGDR